MSRAADRVRCYNCGRPGARDAPSCSRCGANFRALCPCGADICIYEDECPACRAPHVPKRMPLAKHPAVRAAKWSALAVAVAFAANVAFAPRRVPAWKLKEQAKQLFTDGKYELAAKAYETVTDRSPADAEGWFMHALCLQRLGLSADAYLPDVQKAVLVAPGNVAIRSFLARQALNAGQIDRALEHAEVAAHSPEADGRAFELLAEIEMRRPQPNLAAVEADLGRARAAGIDTPELKVLLAEVSLRLYGVKASETGRLPQRVNVALREAAAALDVFAARERDSPTVGIERARVLLALGRADDAFTAADGALKRLASDAPPANVAEVRLLRAMALHARGSRAEAMVDFAAALHDAPEARIASAASAYLVASDDGDSAHALLVAAAASNDPSGAVRAVLAAALLAGGKLDEAATAITAARRLSPSNASFAEIEGAIRAAQAHVARGADVRTRIDESRAAYAFAAQLAPHLAGPRIGGTLAQLAGGDADDATKKRVAAEVEALRKEFGDDARILWALGRVRLDADDVEGAREVLEKAKDAAPADAVVWRTLAVARRKSKTPNALLLAADAYARARMLEPNDVSLVVAEVETRLAAGDASSAVAACTERLRRHPDEPTILALRAQAYRSLAMWPSAAVDLKRLRAARPDDDRVLPDLIDTLFRAGKAEDATRVIAEARPGASAATVNMIEFLSDLHSGDVTAALDRLKRSGPSTFLAEAQLAAGRVDEAIEILRGLNRSRPGDAAVTRLLVIALLDAEPAVPGRTDEVRAVIGSLPPDAPRGLRALLEGRLLVSLGEFAKAADVLATAYRELPADAFAAAYYGEALFRTGERVESLAAFRRAASTQRAPRGISLVAATRLLQASHETKDDAAAEALAREATQLAPGSVDAAERLSEVLAARGADLEAAQAAENGMRIPDVPPERVRRLRLLAACARLDAGQFTATETLLDDVAPTGGDAAVVGLLRGFAKLGAKRFDEADKAFVAVLAIDPKQSTAQFGRVQTALAAGHRPEASALCDAWRAAHPDDRRFVVSATRLFLRRGFFDTAVSMARQALDAKPDDVPLGFEYASTLAGASRSAEAVAACRDVVTRLPPASKTAGELKLGAFMLAAPDSAAEAVDLARRIAAATAPGGALGLEARVLEAEALLACGRVSEADAAAQTVLKRWAGVKTPPEERGFEARLRFVLGTAACAAGRFGDAADHFSQGMELAPSDDATANNLAWLYGQSASRAADGATIAKRVTARTPGNSSFWDTRATCSAAAGDDVDAEGAWRKALELYADAPASDRRRRADTALHLVKFLASRKRTDAAREAAKAALEYAVGTPAEVELRRFL